MFTQVNLAVPDGDTLASAFGKVNSGLTDSIYAICMGLVQGWRHSIYPGTGTPTAPEAAFWINQATPAQFIRCVYGYSGGLVRTALYQYTLDNGAHYTSIGTLNFWYDGDNNLLSASWS